jgi:negative regulator of sigma E activity
MNAEELEFAITQYLDGTLPPAQVAELEAKLPEDSAARALLEEYRSLNQTLKAQAPLPAIEWNKLAAHLSKAVAEDAEQLEFAASQYADGMLLAEEVPGFELELKEGALAQQLVDEHRAVTRMVKTPAVPAIAWKRLASHISDSVAEANEPRTIKLFARPWVRSVVGMAMAACLMLVTGVGIHSYLHRGQPGKISQVQVGGPGGVALVPTKSPIEVEISGPEQSKGTAVAEISIGAAPDAGGDSPAFADGIVGGSARSLIATNGPAVQDSELALDTYGMPY